MAGNRIREAAVEVGQYIRVAADGGEGAARRSTTLSFWRRTS